MRKSLAGGVLVLMLTLVGARVGAVSVAGQMADAFNPICDDKKVSAELREQAGCERQKGGERIASLAENIINIAIGLVGVVSVAVIVFGGQRYVVSNGDPGKLKQAKDMILYALIGLVIAILAFVIVNFVLNGIL